MGLWKAKTQEVKPMVIVHVGSIVLQVGRKDSRREYVEELVAQIREQVRWIVARCIEEALEGEVTSLLGRQPYERRRPPGEEIAAVCSHCGSRDAQDFRRDGHYPRYLDTAWGRLKIRVPQLECVCKGSVKVPFQTLRSRQRLWDDLEGEIRERYGWGMSLRWIKACVDTRLKSSVGLRTLNERVRQMAQLAGPWRQSPLEDVPPVVRVDGIWVTLMRDTEEVKKDRLGRNRAVKTGQKVPILVAQGVWPASGRQEVVAWVAGSAEDEESWEALFTQMWERGISPKRGFQLLVGDGAAGLEQARRTVYWDVPFQRCVFHKLRNIWRDIVLPDHLEGEAARAYKRRFIRGTAQIWHAPDEQEARRRQSDFCSKWEEAQPAAIATTRRDFEETLVFYRIQTEAALRGETWPARRLRTTAPLEREFRAVRRRVDGATLFHSPSGLTATFHQLLVRRSVHRDANALPGTWQLELERSLAALNHIS
jgi:transposase-like protein